MANAAATAICHCGGEQSPGVPMIIPDEPREQAEGAEAEDNNPPARAPFAAQFSALKKS